MKIVVINAIWCSACLVMKKVWSSLEKEYEDVEIVNYDYDFDEEIVETYNVGTVLPVAIFYKNDKEYVRLSGEKSKEEMIKVIEEMSR